MSDGALNPEKKPVEAQLVELPPAMRGKVPQSAAPAVRELFNLSGKERAQVFKAFGKTPPAELARLQVSHTTSTQTIISSPLPPAAELEHYERIVPGAAARLLAMAEKQQAHRMGLESTVIGTQNSQSATGQKLAFSLGVLGLLAAVTLSYMGHPTVGGAIGSLLIGTLAVAFLIGKSEEKKNRQKKMEGG